LVDCWLEYVRLDDLQGGLRRTYEALNREMDKRQMDQLGQSVLEAIEKFTMM